MGLSNPAAGMISPPPDGGISTGMTINIGRSHAVFTCLSASNSRCRRNPCRPLQNCSFLTPVQCQTSVNLPCHAKPGILRIVSHGSTARLWRPTAWRTKALECWITVMRHSLKAQVAKFPFKQNVLTADQIRGGVIGRLSSSRDRGSPPARSRCRRRPKPGRLQGGADPAQLATVDLLVAPRRADR